ncbi:MAG TPA: transcriptional regulator [Bacteroidales bacterium]|nr:MAG: transcriptional regulator [Bacteroidetes bacterium GWF2_33_38]OFY74778.1 MAG: transcriptional regulator [Bacteroidetes bacterium RIFOXYA12_FULL_33_9]HBF87091.1 transcriptional regulator [Bacteroidales bacterium]
MEEIRMVDLKGQYLKIKNEIDKAVIDVIGSTAFINGPEVNGLQKDLEKYLDVKHVVPCANGTDALQVALMALDLQAGDEIITTNFTFIATVEVIALLGLKPVLVDVDPQTYNINPDEIEKVINKRTKAIIPVHLFGQCVDMDRIMSIANKHNLYVIEDTAQAIGADYIFDNGSKKKAGTIGHIGCTSFFPSKNLGCYGDGGAIFTNNDKLAERLRSIVNHGMKVRYYHDEIGVNSRLDSIQAAILKIKLKHLDEYNTARIKVADFYDAAFSKYSQLQTPKRFEKSSHTFHQYTLVTKGIDRVKLQTYLQEKKIPAMIYYPVPLHLQKAFEKFDDKNKSFPITEKLCETVISLPMHTELSNEQLSYITNNIINFLEK